MDDCDKFTPNHSSKKSINFSPEKDDECSRDVVLWRDIYFPILCKSQPQIILLK